MSIGIRVAKIRLLDTRQSFRLGAEHRLEPDEWPELATHRFCLPQTEPVDHLIASAPYVSYLDPSTEYAIPVSKTLSCHSSALYRRGKIALGSTCRNIVSPVCRTLP